MESKKEICSRYIIPKICWHIERFLYFWIKNQHYNCIIVVYDNQKSKKVWVEGGVKWGCRTFSNFSWSIFFRPFLDPFLVFFRIFSNILSTFLRLFFWPYSDPFPTFFAIPTFWYFSINNYKCSIVQSLTTVIKRSVVIFDLILLCFYFVELTIEPIL